MIFKKSFLRILFIIVFIYSLLLNVIFLSLTHLHVIKLNVSIWQTFNTFTFKNGSILTRHSVIDKNKQIIDEFHNYKNITRENIIDTVSEHKYAPGLIVDWFKDVLVHPTLYNLKWNPLFPDMPTETTVVNSLTEKEYMKKRFARRIYGFLIPDESCRYYFEIGSRDGLELLVAKVNKANQMSLDEMLTNYNLRLNFTFTLEEMTEQDRNIHESEIFKKVVTLSLKKSELYFIDILQGGWNYGRMNIRWRKEKSENFSEIIPPYLFHLKTMKSQLHKKTLYSKPKPIRNVNKNEQLRMRHFSIPRFELHNQTKNMSCGKYRKENMPVDMNNAVYFLDYWATYPDDSFGYYKPFEKHVICLDENEAITVVNKTLKALNDASVTSEKFRVQDIVQVQRNFNLKKKISEYQQFYFVEFDIISNSSPQVHRVSTYVELTQNETFCIRNDFTWDSTSKIYLLTPVKDQAHWIHHMLHSIENIINATNEQNIELIIVDFKSSDTDVKKLLESHRVPFIYIGHNETKFNKVQGLNIALKHVENDSIAFVLDLHLEFPNNLFDKIRKHTIKGISAYTPTLMKLDEGTHEQYYDKPPTEESSWLWLVEGVGMISLYKSDWNAIGGMDENKFGTKWGGEDWELLGRLLENGYYIFHMRLPRFYHIFHSNKDLWDGNKSFSEFQ